MRAVRIVSVSLAALLVARPAFPTVLTVSQAPGAPFPTIQSAINAARPNLDDVLVTCGRYQESVTMKSGVDVRGANHGCVILQAPGGATAAVTFPVLSAPTELSRMTIRADASWPAIRASGGRPIITSNVIEGSSYGIDLFSYYDSAAPLVSQNVVRSNGLVGIRVQALHPGSAPVVTSNLVVNSGTGIAVATYSSDVVIANNTIVSNAFAGLYMYGPGGAGTVIANNVIVRNSGGGIRYIGAAAPQIVKNDVWSNTPFNFDVSTGDPSAANFSADPLFVDEVAEFAGFQPRSYSPLVDVARQEWAPARDLRGIPWVAGRACGPAPDIGARENEGISGFHFWGGYGLQWDPLPGPCAVFGPEYQVRRGDLAVLRATGVYVQDPVEVPAAEHWCEVFPGAFGDPDNPAAGEGYFYLVTGWSNCETPLGFTSAPSLRPGTVCWGECNLGP